MARFLKNKKASIGKAPEELIFIGERKVNEASLKLIDYGSETILEKDLSAIKDALSCIEGHTVTWINIYGIHNTKLINEIGEAFNIHPLTLEDILHTGQRPKMEEYDDYLVFILKIMNFDETMETIKSEQLSLILGRSFLITFQERSSDIFKPVINRIRKNKGRIRERASDYLAYALLDTIIDHYLLVIGKLGDKIEEIESDLISNPSKEILTKIYRYKQEISYLRKSIRPTKNFILQLCKIDTEFFKEETAPFLKDLLDLSTQAREIVDIYGVILTDYLNFYDSVTNNKLNEIMKILTIFSVTFIPLTFIAGIYGTNFEYIPELKYKYSYFIFWSVLILTGIGMLAFFKRKKWL